MLYADKMIRKLFNNTLYVKIYQNRFDLKHIESGDSRSVIAQKAFSTERLLLGQFTEAEETLKKGLEELYTGRWFAPSPVAIVQPMEKVEGGLSQVEERVFRELIIGAGARAVFVWVGSELSDQEVLAKARGE